MVDFEQDRTLPWGAVNKAWRNWAAAHAKRGLQTTPSEFTRFTGAPFGIGTIIDQEIISKIKMLTGPDHHALITAYIIRKQHAEDKQD